MGRKTETVFWIISCEGHTDAWVNAPDWEQATVAAAEFWGVPWREVASRCECKRREKALKGVCPKCHRFFYGGAEICDSCQKQMAVEEQNLRQYLKNKYKHQKKRA